MIPNSDYEVYEYACRELGIKPDRSVFEQLVKENLAEKRWLNKLLFDEGNRITLDIDPTPEEIEAEYPVTFGLLKQIFPDITAQDILENRVPSGARLTRTLNKSSYRDYRDSPTLPFAIPLSLPSVQREAEKIFSNGGGIQGHNPLEWMRNFYEAVLSSKVTVTISTALQDILQASEFCSWSSCIRIKGEYGASTFSYLRNNFTAIVYTNKENTERKIGRSFLYFDPHDPQYSIQRTYGVIPLSVIRKIRQYINSRVAQYFNVSESWIVRTQGNFPEDTYTHVPYVDPTRQFVCHKSMTDHYGNSISLEDNPCPVFNFVLEHPLPVCPGCGEPHDGEEVGCSDCFSGGIECDRCGEHFNEMEIYSVANGTRVCRECLEEEYTLCVDCSEYYHDEDIIFVEGRGRVCEACFNEGEYIECHSCSYAYEINHCEEINGLMYCKDCAAEAVECFECGVRGFPEEDHLVKDCDGEWLCFTCADRGYFQCESCGVWVSISATPESGELLCISCLEEREQMESAA